MRSNLNNNALEPSRRGDHSQRFGIAQRILLGRQLTDDQRDIGGADDCHREPDILRRIGPDTERLDIFAQRAAQLVTRKGARQHGNAGDANLHSREEAAGLGGQVDGGLCAAPPRLGHRL
jgi:hypothetical protein